MVNIALTQSLVLLLRPGITYQGLAIGLEGWWLGIVGAAFAILPLFLAIPTGRLADSIGERRVLLIGVAGVIAATTVLLFAGSTLPGLIVASSILGVGQLFSIIGQQALISNQPDSLDKNSAFGYYTLWISFGQIFGPLIITIVGGSALIPNTALLFAIAAGLTVPLLIGALAVRDTKARRAKESETPDMSSAELLRLPGIARAIVTSAIIISAIDIMVIYLPALGAERGFSSGVIGIALGLRSASSMVVRVFLGRLTDRVGRARLTSISAFVAAVVFVVYVFPVPEVALIIGGIVLGFGLGIGQPLTMAWVADVTPPGTRGKAVGLRLLANRVGILIVPAGAGLLAAATGAAGVFGGTAIILAGAGWLSRQRRRGATRSLS